MRFKGTLLWGLVALLGLASNASATAWIDLTGTADCTGYSVTGTASFPAPQFRSSADADYVITLSQGATVLATVTGIVTLTVDVPTFTLSAPWGLTLCGDYSAAGTFHLQTPDNDTRTFSAAFTCDCPPPPPPPDGCHYTPGYWKNHAEAWPMTSITLGGVTYAQDQAIAIMNTPVGGDVTIILAYHLIAAKLNVASGTSHSIDDAIAAADAYLIAHPLYSKPTGAAKTEGENIKNELAAYNEMGCPGEASSMQSMSFESTGEASASWGSLKSIYR